MLVLGRRIGESIVVGDNVVVRIMDIVGNQIRIGIDAPADVPIHREEIFKRLMEEDGKLISFGKKI
jgi:carbon storage regulator